ncbi:restriction endonuclease subunit S [Faecalibacterium prausnitzii]|nr:restriction endonuclease subunit S [Faecalibacterium prausnitzii]
MSKLDELIREFCPNGVEYKRLEECCTLVKGKTPIQKAEPGEYPLVVTTNERKTCNTYQFDRPTVCIPLISSRGHGVASLNSVYYQEGKFALGNILCGVTPNDEDYLSAKFLFEYLNYKKDTLLVPLMKGGANVSMTVDSLKRVSVPVPPMQVQMEVVQLLYKFTELSESLKAELVARQKQYEYYRSRLLTFDVRRGGTIKFFWKTLCEIADISTGNSNTNEAVEDGKYPFFVRSQEPLRKNNYEYDETAIITAGDGAGVGKVYHYIEGKYALHQRAYRIHINTADVLPRYYFHYMKAKFLPYIQKTMFQGSVPSIRKPMLNAFPVPVPSLEIQERIVNVLDDFEKICTDLKIGLPAEIEARQKQYEYYRDKLLTFAETGNTILSRAEQSRAEQSRAEQSRALIKLMQYVFGYAVVSLQDVVKKSCSGGTPKKGVSEYYEDGNIPWLRTQEVVFRDICKTECFITESAVKNSAAKWIPENCVIVAISGATAGRCAINKIPLTTNQHCLNLEVDPEMALYRYVYYCICAKQEELLAKKEGARGDLNSTRILSLQIDLPSIEEQKRIISILDRFDAICNDLTSGLPAEIEARQKQYEYYRDKLLTFKEVAAT